MTIVHNFHKSSKRNLSILGIFIILFVSACSSNEEMPDERLIEKELYDQAQSRLKSESYSTAIMSLEALESRFPFGRYAEQAQAELIYAYYMNSQFEASQSAAERFINLHPRHSHTGYAYYMKGLAAFTDDSGLFSRYFQSDLEKREVVMAQTSFDELSEFISRYPQSNYVSHAKQRMIYLKNLLAKHEMYVADFYMQRGAYLAAIGRSKYVIEHLPNTPQTPYALSILVEAYDLLGYEDLKKRNLNILTSNYPDFNFQENESIKTRSWTNVLTFGLLGKEDIERPEPVTQ
jgi:outer membrane protein assembly factor BamD|tara:strand:+ start:611 stop:1483 length:873 start_codon:yes stop_codon:yes gene_type:complete